MICGLRKQGDHGGCYSSFSSEDTLLDAQAQVQYTVAFALHHYGVQEVCNCGHRLVRLLIAQIRNNLHC